jgi:cellulose synthase/poly-beta-1,6-N-acetylglucosamine synthase-like glycosyltransferase
MPQLKYHTWSKRWLRSSLLISSMFLCVTSSTNFTLPFSSFLRKNNIKVFNFPRREKQNLRQDFINLVKRDLNVTLEERDVAVIHRLPAEHESSPLIVCLFSSDVKRPQLKYYTWSKRWLRSSLLISSMFLCVTSSTNFTLPFSFRMRWKKRLRHLVLKMKTWKRD